MTCTTAVKDAAHPTLQVICNNHKPKSHSDFESDFAPAASLIALTLQDCSSPPGGKSTFGRLSSGASPELIAGTSDFPPGEEVLHDLNGRSWLPAFWQVAEASSNFRRLRKYFFNYFWAMHLRVCVCYMSKFGAMRLPVPRT